jgi:hypothetical protein
VKQYEMRPGTLKDYLGDLIYQTELTTGMHVGDNCCMSNFCIKEGGDA